MEPLNVQRMVSARIPTDEAEFHLFLYHNNHDDKEHLVVVLGDVRGKPEVLVRLHSECFTGDVLGSRRCDCGEQLSFAMQQIALEGEGVLVYLRQEGRGIGLARGGAAVRALLGAFAHKRGSLSSPEALIAFERIRKLYYAINENHRSEGIPEETIAYVESIYKGPNRRLCGMLVEMGYRDLPEWVNGRKISSR